jgi:hypothetical protein
MIVPIDPEAFAAAGLEVIEGDAVASFMVPPPADRPNDPPREVKVAVVGTGLHFFPQRSSAQKRVLALLGFAVE